MSHPLQIPVQEKSKLFSLPQHERIIPYLGVAGGAGGGARVGTRPTRLTPYKLRRVN